MLSNTRGRDMWHAQIKRSLRCPDMDNRRYSHESLRWVLKREITIKNFTTRELKWGRTELHYACLNDEAWIARACIAFNGKKDMNAPDEDGRTPLHYACVHAHVDMVKLLLESGAQPSLYHKDHGCHFPIDRAIDYGRFDKVKLLLSYHEKDKKRALENLGEAFRSVAYKQNLEIVQLFLIACGADIVHSCDSDDGYTALHKSCWESDDTEVTEFLLESGAKVNAVDTDGWTPLFSSIHHGNLECTKVLLAAGATVNHRRTDGRTPLDWALAHIDYYGSTKAARAEIVEVLEAAGALTAAQLPDDDDDEDGEA